MENNHNYCERCKKLLENYEAGLVQRKCQRYKCHQPIWKREFEDDNTKPLFCGNCSFEIDNWVIHMRNIRKLTTTEELFSLQDEAWDKFITGKK